MATGGPVGPPFLQLIGAKPEGPGEASVQQGGLRDQPDEGEIGEVDVDRGLRVTFQPTGTDRGAERFIRRYEGRAGADHEPRMGEWVAFVPDLAKHERAVGVAGQCAEMWRKARDEGEEPRLGIAGDRDTADAGGAGVGIGPGKGGMAQRQKALGKGQGGLICWLDRIGARGHGRACLLTGERRKSLLAALELTCQQFLALDPCWMAS